MKLKGQDEHFNQKEAFGILCRYSDSPQTNEVMDYSIHSYKQFYSMSEDLVPKNKRRKYFKELEAAYVAYVYKNEDKRPDTRRC